MTTIKRILAASAILTAMLGIAVLSAHAGSYVYETDDTSPAFRVYNGSDGTVVIGIVGAGAHATNNIVFGSNYTAIDGSGNTDTIAEFVAALNAATNAAGVKLPQAGIYIDDDCSLGTDSTDGELLTGTYTIASGEVGEILWDTSGIGSWSVYVPGFSAYTTQFKDVPSPVSIKGLHANGGSSTGVVTVTVYKDGSSIWADTASSTPTLNLGSSSINLPLNPNSDYIIRADPAGVIGTGGTVGVTVE